MHKFIAIKIEGIVYVTRLITLNLQLIQTWLPGKSSSGVQCIFCGWKWVSGDSLEMQLESEGWKYFQNIKILDAVDDFEKAETLLCKMHRWLSRILMAKLMKGISLLPLKINQYLGILIGIDWIF